MASSTPSGGAPIGTSTVAMIEWVRSRTLTVTVSGTTAPPGQNTYRARVSKGRRGASSAATGRLSRGST